MGIRGEPKTLDSDAEEMPPTLRGATALWLLLTRGPMTTADMAVALGMSHRGVLYVMDRLSLSRRFPVLYLDGHWVIDEDHPRWQERTSCSR